VRRGQKAEGLISKMAELPKDDTSVSSAFFMALKVFLIVERGKETLSKGFVCSFRKSQL